MIEIILEKIKMLAQIMIAAGHILEGFLEIIEDLTRKLINAKYNPAPAV